MLASSALEDSFSSDNESNWRDLSHLIDKNTIKFSEDTDSAIVLRYIIAQQY